MIQLSEIQAPVSADLERFDLFFRENLKVGNRYISTIIDYVVSKRGKQMRPLLVLLTAGLNGEINRSTYLGASFVEIIHNASLIHDDVVDEAFHRRGEFSVNALLRSKQAVLIGDFLLARGINIVTNENEFEILKIVVQCVEGLCEGELIQMEHSQLLDMTEAIYFDIILKKTGRLMGVCGAVGAESVGAGAQAIERMHRFGELIGLAFQVKDDILDYSDTGITGKLSCNDLFEKKITLPLLYLLNASDRKQQRVIISKLSHIRQEEGNAAYLRDLVLGSGGVDYAERRMQEFKREAVALLDGYPESPYKRSLIGYADFVLNRSK